MEHDLSILVAIASYGTAQDRFLKQLVTEYQKLNLACRVVVLSDRAKPVHGAEVLTGLPSRNPYSLPFAHRKLFSDNRDDYDLFIYAEDDTLLTGRHIESFLTMQEKLKENEILGFMRSETNPAGETVITSIHHHFRWLPDTVVERGGDFFAQFSNRHSGCFIATRQQLARAIASGGFLVPPHDERYGMLETAASDIYTQCGLKRLLCVSRIQDFIVPHLANKYYSHMGIPVETLEQHALTLSELHADGRWTGSLFEPQTRAVGFRWSKDLHEGPDEALLLSVPPTTKSLLSVGAGSGENELWLQKRGIHVCAIPMDAVLADALERRGIRTVEGPFEEVVARLSDRRFDAVLLADVLHLVPSPTDWLQKLRSLLVPDGCVVASVSHTLDLLGWLGDLRDGRRRPWRPDFETTGAHPVSVRILRRWFRSAGFACTAIAPIIHGSRRILRKAGIEALERAFAAKFVVTARRSS